MSGYVALDGPDGCGKSSQALALCEYLRSRGRVVQHVREPGSTPVGEALRQLLLSPQTGDLQPITEALLFSAARAELVSNVIAPALQRDEWVVAERCYLSTVVYQGLAPQPGLPVDWLFDLTRAVHGACLPDLLCVLDLPGEISRQRRALRTHDRIEARSPEYHERVRRGYLQAAAQEPRACVIDAARSFAAVQVDLQRALARWLA